MTTRRTSRASHPWPGPEPGQNLASGHGRNKRGPVNRHLWPAAASGQALRGNEANNVAWQLIKNRRSFDWQGPRRYAHPATGPPLWLFQRDALEGLKLLLKAVRGEKIDWANYRVACYAINAKSSSLSMTSQSSSETKLEATCAPSALHASTRTARPAASSKRKLPSGTERLRCAGCGFEKVEYTPFPQAHLRQSTVFFQSFRSLLI